MEKKTRQERELEEKRLLIQVLKAENGGNSELTMIDYELIQSSLAVMKTFTLIPQNKRGRRMLLSDHLDNLIDLSIAKTKAAGYAVNPIEINPSDVDKIIYNFHFRYSKSKGKDNHKRIHVDNYETTGFDEEQAVSGLKKRLKTLKEVLIEIKSVKKSHSIYMMKDGSTVNAENVVGLKN